MRYRLDPLSPYGISPEVENKVVQAANGFAVRGKDGADGVGVSSGGTTGQVLKKKSNTDFDTEWGTVSGTGDVVGPASATDSNLAAFDTATGKLIKDSGSKASDFAASSHNHSYNNLDDKPTLGTAAAKNIPATGNASATEVVYGSDTRLTDARTPASHGNEAHSATFITAGDIPAIPDSVDDLSPSQTGNNGKFLKTNGTTATWESIPGGGDMLAATYDPAGGAGQVAFASDLGTAAAEDVGAFAPALGEDDNYVTDVEKSNLHAPGSDNQDLSGLMPKTGGTFTNDINMGSGKSVAFNNTSNDSILYLYNNGASGASVLQTGSNFVANNISSGATVSGSNTGDNAANTSIAATKLDDFTAPDDNTDLNATTSAHGLLLKATAPAAGLINVVGIANGETSYANKALFDTTDPTACILGNSADDGTATVAARRDHQHAMPTLTTMYNLFYPVGCIYTTTVSTNPGTLFGVGTWEAFGEGRVLVGKAGSGTFNTAGATGGVETVTLTAAQSGLPAHTHVEKVGNGSSGSTLMVPQVYYNATASFDTNTSTKANTAANAAEAHTNLQPYIVVYMWKRTA